MFIPAKYSLLIEYNTFDFNDLGRKVRGRFSREISFTSWIQPDYDPDFKGKKFNYDNWDKSNIFYLTSSHHEEVRTKQKEHIEFEKKKMTELEQ